MHAVIAPHDGCRFAVGADDDVIERADMAAKLLTRPWHRRVPGNGNDRLRTIQEANFNAVELGENGKLPLIQPNWIDHRLELNADLLGLVAHFARIGVVVIVVELIEIFADEFGQSLAKRPCFVDPFAHAGFVGLGAKVRSFTQEVREPTDKRGPQQDRGRRARTNFHHGNGIGSGIFQMLSICKHLVSHYFTSRRTNSHLPTRRVNTSKIASRATRPPSPNWGRRTMMYSPSPARRSPSAAKKGGWLVPQLGGQSVGIENVFAEKDSLSNHANDIGK